MLSIVEDEEKIRGRKKLSMEFDEGFYIPPIFPLTHHQIPILLSNLKHLLNPSLLTNILVIL
jgi:hypothetical protein